jgi:transposase-like protein
MDRTRGQPAVTRQVGETAATVTGQQLQQLPTEVRKIIYTTNAIESLNYQLRKIIKNRGHFPSDDAVIKLLWLAIRDIEDKRARARAKE